MVCKIGGSIVNGIHGTFIDDLVELQNGNDAHLILVHGGGDQVTEIAEKLGKKQSFITSPEGIKSRYTDKETAEIFTMVMSGLVAKQIVQTLERRGVSAVSLSGLDAGILKAERKKRLVVVDEKGRKIAIEGGYTGKIASVGVDFLERLFEARTIPVISPVAAGLDDWELLNIDGDRACSHIAGAMKADVAIFLTDVEGLILNNELVKSMSTKEARESLKMIGPGMEKKVLAASEAVEMGAKKSVIASGLVENPLKKALQGMGTVVTR